MSILPIYIALEVRRWRFPIVKILSVRINPIHRWFKVASSTVYIDIRKPPGIRDAWRAGIWAIKRQLAKCPLTDPVKSP